MGAPGGLGEGLRILKSVGRLLQIGSWVAYKIVLWVKEDFFDDAGLLTLSSVLCCTGLLTGNKIAGLRMRLQDGAHHVVDSSDLAFNLATQGAMKQGKHRNVRWL